MSDFRIFDKAQEHFRTIFDTEASGRLILYSPIVGIVAGLGAAAFFYLLNITQDFLRLATSKVITHLPQAVNWPHTRDSYQRDGGPYCWYQRSEVCSAD